VRGEGYHERRRRKEETGEDESREKREGTIAFCNQNVGYEWG
jgi:hypothetical protein